MRCQQVWEKYPSRTGLTVKLNDAKEQPWVLRQIWLSVLGQLQTVLTPLSGSVLSYFTQPALINS